MEDNDLPDFDADDLLAAMEEELRKDQVARQHCQGDEGGPVERHEDASAAGETGAQSTNPTGDSLMEVSI